MSNTDVYYYIGDQTKRPVSGPSGEIVDLVDSSGVKQGFITSHRFTLNSSATPPSYAFPPYNVHKSINTPKGTLQVHYQVTENLPVSVTPTYTAGYPLTTNITREILSSDSQFVYGKITLTY
jgi:hypothetical protein